MTYVTSKQKRLKNDMIYFILILLLPTINTAVSQIGAMPSLGVQRWEDIQQNQAEFKIVTSGTARPSLRVA